MHRLWRSPLCVVVAALAAAQSPTVDPAQRFSMDLPDGWRSLTPDEGQQLLNAPGNRVPEQLLRPQPPSRLLHFGNIDQWLKGSYDGRALSVVELQGEVKTDAAGVADLEQQLQAAAEPGYQPKRFERVVVGAAEHPAIVVDGRVGTQTRRRDLFVPSGGDTLWFQLRWPQDADDIEPMWTRLQQSLALARAAVGTSREGLGSKLFYAALAGIGVGVLLTMLRRSRRAPSAAMPTPPNES